MPIVLGIVAALAIGVSDTCGQASARRASAISHVNTQMVVGTVLALPLTLVISSQWIWADVISGGLSGILVALGLTIVYRAMADSSSVIAAPLAGVLAAVIPLGWDLLGGTAISTLSLVGCAIAIAAMAIVTFDPTMDGGTVRNGVLLALAGGVFFGLSIALAGDTSEASGVWPVVFNRALGFVALVPLVAKSRVPLLLSGPVLRFGLLGGAAGAIGMVALVIGSQRGNLGTVSVIAATYPAVIVVLASTFDDDSVRWWQALGVAGAIAGTALIALG